MVTFTADLGEGEELAPAREKALLLGVKPGNIFIEDLREECFNLWGQGAGWEGDYGNPQNPDDFKALYAYSPYHNVRPGTHYPAMFIVTGDHDARVMPAHSFKFAAALQATQAGSAPILLRVPVFGRSWWWFHHQPVHQREGRQLHLSHRQFGNET